MLFLSNKVFLTHGRIDDFAKRDGKFLKIFNLYPAQAKSGTQFFFILLPF